MGAAIFKQWKGSTGPSPGTWRPATVEGIRTATIACPNCGLRGSLNRWDISPTTGAVTPSIHCDCGFHKMIILEGWEP